MTPQRRAQNLPGIDFDFSLDIIELIYQSPRNMELLVIRFEIIHQGIVYAISLEVYRHDLAVFVRKLMRHIYAHRDQNLALLRQTDDYLSESQATTWRQYYAGIYFMEFILDSRFSTSSIIS
jgi:hypothetical protein